LLEKAWAKLHGSYERVESGVPLRAMMDLCGAPGRSYQFDDPETRQEIETGNLFNTLCEYDQQGFLMVTGTPGYDNMTKNEEARSASGGIVPGHAYTLKSAKAARGVRLMEMRNPWGRFEWDGDWNDKCERWTDETLQEFGHTLNAEDGLFWISEADVYKNFMDTHVVYLRGNVGAKHAGNPWAESRTEFVTTDQDMCSEVLEFEVSEPAFGFVTLMQRDTRVPNTREYVEFAYAVFGPCDAAGTPSKEVLRSPRWINREITEEIPESSPLEKGKYLVAVYNVTKTPDLPVVLVTHLSVGSDDKENSVRTSIKPLTAQLRQTLMLTSATTSKACSLNSYGPLDVAMSFVPSHGFALAARSKAATTMSVKFDFSGSSGLELLDSSGMVASIELAPGAELGLVAELRCKSDTPSFAMGLSYRFASQ